ncbi:hypothetical protein [Halarcobacter sp.]|uniref:hypothetical protein n=1 Tax=Halarcobacter sp. TaxID=2321133 RepID=UPI002AAAD3AC|nr:hypothetical protein [Halarcobacter sp.]
MSIEQVEKNTNELNEILTKLLNKIDKIQIGTKEQFPFGWKKAAKGRTVWRILEEAINQNLEKYIKELGFDSMEPASSEVGVYDFSLTLNSKKKVYVNIKSAVKGGKKNKDDISKAYSLESFFSDSIDSELYIASFEISFSDDMYIKLENCYVMPIMWLPDIYINPSNNGNLQSSKYKEIDSAIKRTNIEFLEELKAEIKVAERKKAEKNKKKA